MNGLIAGLIAGSLAAGAAAAFLHYRWKKRLAQFMAFAGHEMNTPSTALRLTVLNFLEGVFGDVPPDQRAWIEIMGEQTWRLSALVAELRDFVHLELAADIALRPEPSDVREIAQEARRSIRKGLEQSGIAFDDRMIGEFPKVFVDFDRTTRVLSALFFYARKFHRAGSLQLRALADGRFVDLHLQFASQPTTARELERSLDLFYPAALAHDPRMRTTGFGLGFARSLMRAQQGDLLSSLSPDGILSLTLRLPQAEVQHGR